jgi:monofunctional biosynthetic peptidoglycan transglycosylase
MARISSVGKAILITILVIVLVPVVFTGFFLVFPNISKLKQTNPEKTSFMKYREHEWRRKGDTRTMQQVWVPLPRISPYIITAVIISEDDNFWTHHGFDYDAIRDAYRKNIERKSMRYGGSTITQQLAKNLYLSPSKNPTRKVIETIITWRLERTLPKKRILELYLNVIEWGDGIFGIEAAAHHYFGKSAASLGPNEAARLAVILPNPIKYRLNGSSRYIERRSRIIYSRMVRRGMGLPDSVETGGDIPETDEDTPDTEETP